MRRGAAREARARDRDRRRRASSSTAGSTSLPFEPTGDQRAAFDEIDADLAAGQPMQRLLMGEVGSGKTVVAVYAMLRALEAGHQAALMAPTETLAEQHAATLDALLGGRGDPVRAAHRRDAGGAAARDARPAARPGELGLIVGTHALIEPDVEFAALAVCVVDEQHRFGVRQRAALDAKGPGDAAPHVLHMTATPIPRTLSLTAYGDLDTTDDPRAARGPPAGQDLGGRRGEARRRLRVHPRAPARGPPGLRRLPAGRRLGEAAGEGGRAPRPSGCATGELADFEVEPAARADVVAREGRGDGGASPRARPTCSSRRP